MTDTTTTAAPAAKAKKVQVAVRDWLNPNSQPVESGKEAEATGFRYIHLPTAKRLQPAYNPESDAAPAEAVFEYNFAAPNAVPEVERMCAIFGALTLAGNVVNTAVNGPKGDPNINPIPLIAERFKDIEAGNWSDREGGGIRYDRDKLAAAIASAKGETDPAPYLAKMDGKVDPKTGAAVAADTKGAISYGAYALRNAKVKAEYDKLTGGGADLGAL